MACPPTPPAGVSASATAEEISQMIDEAADEAVNGATPEIRASAHVRMLVLHQYLTALVNCHMATQVAGLTKQVAALKAAMAPKLKAAKASRGKGKGKKSA
jgi:ABC-type transporter MlaC component